MPATIAKTAASSVLGIAILIATIPGELWPSPRAAAQSPPVVTYSGGQVTIGGPFTLVDQNNVTRRDTDFRGKLMLIYFGNTYCREACPIELQKMSEVIDLLGDRSYAVQPLFISFDPKRDTPKRLKAYLGNFNPRILGLTGSDEQIIQVTDAYKASYDRVELPGGDYDFDHTSLTYLMDRDGNHLAHFGTSVSAAEIAAAILKVI